MKIQNEKLRISLLALAVQGALLAMCAMPVHADDDEATALKMPTNYVEIGAENTSRSAARFGAYNGLDKSGADVVGNFSVRGGDAYGDSNGTRRWSITGSDLGTTSRTLGTTISNQGKWNIGIGYDELRHNLSDTYQTPYQGSMGGNNFTLPAGFGVVTSGTGLAGTRGLNPAQQAALHTVDIGTTRKNTSLNVGVNLSPEWNLTFDFNQLKQSGAKLMGFGSAASGAGVTANTGEAVSILPNPTNYKTDTINLALNWAGEKAYMTSSYFGSFFRDGYDRVTFQTYSVPATSTLATGPIQTMTTPPSNNFHQLNLNGGYELAAKTKLTGGLSYARNTQNDAFVVDPGVMITPPASTSLNGLVVNTHADVKLIDQTTSDLTLSAGVKYDKRDNRTASNIYNFNSLANSANTAAHYPNTPLSNKKTQLELAGDYRLDKSQNIRLAYNREDVRRWCNQYATGVAGTAGINAYVTGVNNYPAGTNCVVATGSKDDKLSAAYKFKASEDVKLNLGYTYSNRKSTFDPNAIAAFISQNGNATGGTIRGINAGDFAGFHPFFEGSRKQQLAKVSIAWQASNKLSVTAGARYTGDKYDTTYGVTNGNSSGLNLDATYSYGDSNSFAAYLTRQHRQRDMTSFQKAAATAGTTTAISNPANATWSNKLKDDDTTIGLALRHGGLMNNKLELAGDLTYSLGRTSYGTQLNYAGATGGNPLGTPPFLTCSAPQILSCGQLPDITTKTIQLKLTGSYQLDKSSKVILGYIYQNMKSSDYFYNGLQYGYTPNTLMPSNEQSPNYAVNVVTASYIYNF
jgi:MtrB/PioB family decaheme-associated outer membrane protein